MTSEQNTRGLPKLTVTALSDETPAQVLARSETVRSLDLSEPVKDVLARVVATDRTRQLRRFRIVCAVELIDVPELRLEPEVIAELAGREAQLEVELHHPLTQTRKGNGDAMGSPPLVRAEFTVRGRGFDPHELSRLTTLSPDSTSRYAELRSSTGVRGRRLDTWSLSTRPTRSRDFREPLEELLARVLPRASEIRGFCTAHGAEALVECIGEFAIQPPVLFLRAEDFAAIIRLGAGFWYDLYLRERLD